MKKARYLTQAAAIAAIYTAVTAVAAPISFGHDLFQLRVAEAMSVLPLFTPVAILGLFVGCLLSNLLGGMGIVDIVFGSLATLVAAFLTYLLRTRNRALALLPPVVVNAVVVGTYLQMLFFPNMNVLVTMAWVALGQAGACYLLGLPLCAALDKYERFLFR